MKKNIINLLNLVIEKTICRFFYHVWDDSVWDAEKERCATEKETHDFLHCQRCKNVKRPSYA